LATGESGFHSRLGHTFSLTDFQNSVHRRVPKELRFRKMYLFPSSGVKVTLTVSDSIQCRMTGSLIIWKEVVED
jgi:hypothetical protein